MLLVHTHTQGPLLFPHFGILVWKDERVFPWRWCGWDVELAAVSVWGRLRISQHALHLHTPRPASDDSFHSFSFSQGLFKKFCIYFCLCLILIVLCSWSFYPTSSSSLLNLKKGINLFLDVPWVWNKKDVSESIS